MPRRPCSRQAAPARSWSARRRGGSSAMRSRASRSKLDEGEAPVLATARARTGRSAVPAALRRPAGGPRRRALPATQGFRALERERRAQLFTVLGEAGIGKTRLARKLASSLAGEASGAYRPLPLLRRGDHLLAAARDRRAGSRGAARSPRCSPARSDAEVDCRPPRRGASARPRAPLPPRRRSGPFASCSKHSRASSRSFSCFEDVHWGEPTLLDLVEHLADWIREAAVLLICLARPELLEAAPGLGRRQGELDVDPARATLTGRQHERSPASWARSFTEETSRAADSRQRQETRSSSSRCWPCSPRTSGVEGAHRTPTGDPGTARLEARAASGRGAPAARTSAAVEGESFHVGAVAALSPAARAPARRDVAVSSLARSSCSPTGRTMAGEDAFRFRHALIRDAAYEAVTKEERSRATRAAWRGGWRR